MSFETEDVILPKSEKSLFQRVIDEGYSSAQIERILYYGGYKMRGRRCECAAVIFLQKKRSAEWLESEISSGARQANKPVERIAQKDEHPDRQIANAYQNLKRTLKDFPAFVLSQIQETEKVKHAYVFSEKIETMCMHLLRRGLVAWKDRVFTIAFEETRKEEDLLKIGILALREAASYRQQIEGLLNTVGFPLREATLIKKIIDETKLAPPKLLELEKAYDLHIDSSDHVLTDEISAEAKAFFLTLTEEEKQIQHLHYQGDHIVPFDKIGKVLNPSRSGEHCRKSDKGVLVSMVNFLMEKGYYPFGQKAEMFIRYFLENVQDYHLQDR